MSTPTPPPVSVVMPVRNGIPYLEQALQSIVTQTFQDFEMVIYDDGSTDGTRDLLDRWAKQDRRIKVFGSDVSKGLAGSANEAVHSSRGALIARMDADDLAVPERLEKQLEIFRRHSAAVLVGTLSIGIDPSGKTIRSRDRSRLRRQGHFSPFPHGSATFRRSAFDAIDGYRTECDGWEDLDLFERLATVGEVYVLPDALYLYRYHAATNTSTNASKHAEADGGRSYRTAAAVSIWAGLRPPQMRPSQDPSSSWQDRARNRFYATIGTISPRLTRTVMRAWVKARDISAAHRFKDGTEVEWFFRPSS